jgi:hypothetical protein
MICPIKETADPDVSPGGGRGWAGTGVTGDGTGHSMGTNGSPFCIHFGSHSVLALVAWQPRVCVCACARACVTVTVRSCDVHMWRGGPSSRSPPT